MVNRGNRVQIEVDADTTRAERDFQNLGQRIGGLSGTITQARTALLGFGAAIGAVGGAAGIVTMARNIANASDEIQKMAQRTGLSTEALSELRFAAEQSGASLNLLNPAIRRIQRTVEEASRGLGTYQQALADVGLSYQDLANQSPEEQFLRVADAISRLRSEQARTTAAFDLFGDSGVQLLPLISGGRRGIEAQRQEARDLGVTISQQQADAAASFNDAMNRFSEAVTSLQRDVVEPLLPAMTRFINVLAGQREPAGPPPTLEEAQQIQRRTLGQILGQGFAPADFPTTLSPQVQREIDALNLLVLQAAARQVQLAFELEDTAVQPIRRETEFIQAQRRLERQAREGAAQRAATFRAADFFDETAFFSGPAGLNFVSIDARNRAARERARVQGQAPELQLGGFRPGFALPEGASTDARLRARQLIDSGQLGGPQRGDLTDDERADIVRSAREGTSLFRSLRGVNDAAAEAFAAGRITRETAFNALVAEMQASAEARRNERERIEETTEALARLARFTENLNQQQLNAASRFGADIIASAAGIDPGTTDAFLRTNRRRASTGEPVTLRQLGDETAILLATNPNGTDTNRQISRGRSNARISVRMDGREVGESVADEATEGN
jgi:hypothetical protein